MNPVRPYAILMLMSVVLILSGCGAAPRHVSHRTTRSHTGPMVLPGGFVSVCTGGTPPPCH